MIPIEVALRFRRIGMLTIMAVYFLIFVGGIVRASGAGMGCPDWPTCFGHWIPPTDVSELPANYQEIYAKGYQYTTFNATKTWTEYLNRLTGMSIGFMILITVWSSRIYRQNDKTVFNCTLGVLFLVIIQAWLGAAVVASNLKPLIITLHMLLALIIVALLIYAITRSQRDLVSLVNTNGLSPKFFLVLKMAMCMTLVQIAMGTQVREAVDYIAHENTYLHREYWRESFPIIFYVHRSFSSVILFTNLWLVWQLRYQASFLANTTSAKNNNTLLNWAYILASLIVTTILAGVSLDRLGFPAAAQPIHLLMANLIFGAQFFIYISFRYAEKALKPQH